MAVQDDLTAAQTAQKSAPELSTRRKFIAWTIQGAAAALLVSSVGESQVLAVSRLRVPIKGLPQELAGFRVAFASDFHLGRFMSLSALRHAVDTMNALKPDATLLGGDFITGDARFFKTVMPELGRLSARFGVFAVPGNHDNHASPRIYRESVRRAGMTDITNSGAAVGEGGRLWIAGLDDEGTGRPNEALAMAFAPPGAPRIAVTHNPLLADKLPLNYADLILAGHTHGWQIYVPFVTGVIIPVPAIKKYRAGFYQTRSGLMYVTRGVGVIGTRVRLWCSPEVALFELYPAAQ